MAVELLVMGCAACGAGVMALTAPARGRRSRRPGRARVAMPRALEAVGASSPVRALERWGAWRSVAGELDRALRATGDAYPRHAASGLLALSWACCAACLWWLSSSLLGLVVGLVAVPLAVAARASALARAREAALVGEMPDVLRSLATALGAGGTLPQAIEYVATHERGAIAREFERAALGLRCGGTVRDALEGIERRLDVPGVELMTCALLISQRTGSPLRGLFSRSAALVEDQAALKALLSTKTAQVRLSVRIVCLMPVTMVVLLSLMSPEFRAGVMGTTGAACVCVAALLDVVAVLIVRRLMRGVLG